VPVEVVGESPAEKQGIGAAVVLINELEVEALPMDIPEKFEIDISNLSEVDQAIYVKDIKVDNSKVKINHDLEAIVVKVEPPQKEEEQPVPVPTEEEVSAEAVEGEVEAKEGEQIKAEEKKADETPEEK
jgi:hypothetical protein